MGLQSISRLHIYAPLRDSRADFKSEVQSQIEYTLCPKTSHNASSVTPKPGELLKPNLLQSMLATHEIKESCL